MVLSEVTQVAVISCVVVEVTIVELIIAMVNLIEHKVENLDHEGELIHHSVLVDDVRHTEVLDIVEHRAE